ncbi:MAG: AI-2E family transporter [Lachnospiraceae bacterium]|nr:AI-2E family transporter [Lachnospiraceae bacterium]
MFKNKLDKNPKYFTVCFYTVITVIICAVFLKILFNWGSFKSGVSAVISVLAPFLIGIFIAYLFYPLVMLFKKKVFMRVFHEKVSLTLGIIVTYVLILGLLAIIIAYIIPQIGSSLMDLYGKVTSNYDRVPEFFDWLGEQFPKVDFTGIKTWIQENIPTLVDNLSNYITGSISDILSASVTVIKWILNVIIAVIVSIYFIVDKDRLLRGFRRLVFAILKKERGSKFMSVGKNCNTIFGNFLYGKIIDSIIIGIICFFAMWILGLPFCLLVSVIVGITNIIPYFGPFIGAIPGAIIILMVGWQEMLIFIILILCIQLFDGYILGPKILGDGTGLRPLWVIFGIVVGGYIAGPIGMFLGVPTVAVIAYLVNLKTEESLRKQEIESLTNDKDSHKVDKFNVKDMFRKKNTKKEDK